MTITRVRYGERQLLRAEDLSAEQAYRIAAHRRHNIAHHTWGIVHGLQLLVEQENLVVQPGVAVDGYGRDLIVPESVSMPTAVFDQLQSDAVDVWLVYGRVAETPPQRGRQECGPGRHSRWREEARLRLTPAEEGINPRQPIEVPESDLDFGPQETPPDAPKREWPVYLGRVARSGVPATYRIELAGRPYTALVGETITAPSGAARVQVGSEAAGDRRRFAVSLRDQAGTFTDRLTIDREGNAAVYGNATWSGDLIVAEGTVAEEGGTTPAWGAQFRPMATPPAAAMPWQVYHTAVPQGDPPSRQLRLEIGHPGEKGDPTRYRLVIGHADGEGGFMPCFTVKADCTVTVHGNLVTEGQLIEGPIQADPNDPRFGAALADNWAQGLTTALEIFYGNDLDLQLTVQPSVVVGTELPYTVTLRNIGSSTVTDIVVYENLTVDEAPVRQEIIQSGLTLNPNQAHPIVRGFTPGQGAQLSLSVVALGVGSINLQYGSASRTVEIHPGSVG